MTAQAQTSTRIEADDARRAMLKRRGVIAGAATLAAGLIAMRASQSVEAAGNLILETNNTVNTQTMMTASNTFPDLGSVLFLDASAAPANHRANGLDATGANGYPGVFGFGGVSASGSGVEGTGGNQNGTGVVGRAGGNGNGVQGTATNGYGVYGVSTNSIGVFGQTSGAGQYGVLGYTTVPNSTGLQGIANGNGSAAFAGGTGNPNAYAAIFQGTVMVQGRLVVSDPSYKSGALQHPDGSTRLVYCVESPESWIEDFGEGKLVGGKAEVALDKDFAAVVHTDTYHVFLTAYANTNGLHVTNRGATSFTVQEHNSGTASLMFSWRVVAKPKSTVKQERLAKFTMPNLPLPDVSKLPKVPTK